MNSENVCWFKAMLRKWMDSGHYVAIITRGMRDGMDTYLKSIGIDCIAVDDLVENNFDNNKKLYIYGAKNKEDINPIVYSQEDTDYWRLRDNEEWAEKKVKLVGKFIAATNGIPEQMCFADDTRMNIEKMKKN